MSAPGASPAAWELHWSAVALYAVANLYLLEKLQGIPALVPRSDVFGDFESLKKALPERISTLPSR